jgi:hypothetical protein
MCFDFKTQNKDIKLQGKGENRVRIEFYRSSAHITSTSHFSHKQHKQGVSSLYSDDETWTHTSLPLCLLLGHLLILSNIRCTFFFYMYAFPHYTLITNTDQKLMCPIRSQSFLHIADKNEYKLCSTPDGCWSVLTSGVTWQCTNCLCKTRFCCDYISTSNTEKHHYLQKDNYKKIQN